jgi:hypothetical protein
MEHLRRLDLAGRGNASSALGISDRMEEVMLKIATRAMLLTPALAILLPLAAQAADPGFCRGYATAAIRQVRGALNNPPCIPGLQGSRWSADFNVHYSWCLGATYAQAGSERDARTAYLRACAR